MGLDEVAETDPFDRKQMHWIASNPVIEAVCLAGAPAAALRDFSGFRGQF